MVRTLSLFWLFARLSVQNFAAYRVDFIVRFFLSVMHLAAELLAVWTIFHNTRTLNGWRTEHMLILVGVYRLVAGGIRMSIVPNMRKVLTDIHDGTLDFVLLKPINAQVLVSIREFVIWRVSDVLLGAAVAFYGAFLLSQRLSPGPMLVFVLMIAAAFAIIYSIWLMLATLCFWFVRVQNIEMVFWNVFEAGRFPIAIYRPWVQWVLTFIVPLAFITTFPAGTLAGSDGVAGVPSWSPVAAVLIAGVLLAVSSRFWRFGLKHYSGASA
jgi:ABC-2 type transport system permease protein